MISLILGFLRPVLTPLMIAGAVFATFLGMRLWDEWIDDPAVAREARQEYVHVSEKASLEARLAEAIRQKNAGQLALADYAHQLAIVQRQQALDVERTEQRIADYEAQLEAAGRSCRLDDADIEWLSQP